MAQLELSEEFQKLYYLCTTVTMYEVVVVVHTSCLKQFNALADDGGDGDGDVGIHGGVGGD